MSVENIITEKLDIWTSAIKTKSASGRGSSNKLELYGIKKLRDLILTLGVQGKLTGDSEIEDSASELLNEITSIREALVENEGLKTKASHKINDSEIYFDVPESWSVCRLGNLAKFIDYRGKTPNKIEKGVRLITAKNVRFGYLSLEPAEYISEDEYTAWMTRGFPQKGDLLFTPEAPLGNVAVIDLTEKFALAQRAICFQFHKTEITPFLKYFIMSSAFQSKLIAESSGMTATGIKASKLKEIIVPLPSLSEQRTIVHKIEELMALCDQLESQTEASIEAHQTLVKSLLETLTNAKDADELNESWQRISAYFDVLFTTEESIDQLKQTILQLAVMGKLVKQDPNDEPACKLLEKLATEKKRLIVAKEAKDSGKVHAKAPINEAFAIPDNWLWVRFRELVWCYRGHNPPKSEFSETPKQGYVRFVQITDFKTDKSAVYVPQSPKNKLVKKGEIIMAAYRHIGKLSRNMEGAFNVALCKIMPFTPMNVDFVELMIGTDVVKGELLRASERGHIPSMHSDHLLSLLVPLPPLAEQKRIVAKADELMSLCETLKIKLRISQETQVDISDAFARQAS